jgi:hypothetical protein
MDKRFVAHPQVRRWLQESILATHVVSFVSHLRDRRYATRTLHSWVLFVRRPTGPCLA